jgi:hypothetical protein
VDTAIAIYDIVNENTDKKSNPYITLILSVCKINKAIPINKKKPAIIPGAIIPGSASRIAVFLSVPPPSAYEVYTNEVTYNASAITPQLIVPIIFGVIPESFVVAPVVAPVVAAEAPDDDDAILLRIIG